MWYNKVNKAEKGIIMSTTWRITNDSIKRSRKAGLEPGQFHMADETLFYGVIEESDQSRWDTIRETLSPELASHILTSNRRYEGKADSLSSLDILDKVAGMVSNGVSEADVFLYLSRGLHVNQTHLNNTIGMNSGKLLTYLRKNGCNRMPIWHVETRTVFIYLGMGKRVA